jgi:hypothetical protein
MGRRFVIFLALSVLAAITANAALSGASFTTVSSTTVRASTAPVTDDRLQLYAGNGQSATAGTAVTTAPSVLVSDANNNPVGGVTVTFVVDSGGGSATGAIATTNASGIATVGSWTLGTTAGANSLTATSAGLTGSPVTFTATGVAGSATRYVVTSSRYTPAAGTSVTITAQLADQYGNQVAASGVSVTFTKTGGGSLSGADPATTNADGVATITLVTSTTPGTAATVTATSSGPSRTGTTPTITTVTGPASSISANAGNGQWAAAGTAVTTAPSVLVTDAYNNPVAGVPVVFAVATGGGSITGANATTNASGIATAGSWTLGTAAGSNTLTAAAAGLTGSPVTFTATGIAGAATKYVVTSSSYSPAAGSAVTITAQLADQYGNAVTTAGISVTFTSTGGGTLSGTNPATTNVIGVATITLATGTTAGASYTVTATSMSPSARTGTTPTITSVAGPATKIAVSAGNGQSATAGTAVTTAPSVLVSDANNNPVGGVSVTFAVASGGGSVTGASATTNASGIAAVGSWTLGTVAGANSLTATSAGLTGSPVTFTATGVAGAATKYVVTSSSYTPVAGVGVTITAQLADQFGNAVKTSGIVVTWSKTGAGGSFASGTSTTNTNGIATVLFTTSTVAGVTYQVTGTDVSSRTGTTPAITTVAGAAKKISANAGSGQTAAAGTAVATAPSVLVSDANNNPVSGVTVTFTVYTGGGSVTGASATTNASGIATVGSWTLGTTPGANSLRATSSGLTGSPVTFSATGVVGPAARYVVTSSSYTPNAGSNVTITAQLADQFGNAVKTSGIVVTWSKTGAGGSFASGTSTTNTNGIATVLFTTGTPAGITYVISATDGSSRSGTAPSITTR